MTTNHSILRFSLLFTVSILFLSFLNQRWGFFGHRRINRLAVFTLPPEMIRFYKANIEYLTEHAVDPDKRRYATRHEAPRHYIDLDSWGSFPFAQLPRNRLDALICRTDLYATDSQGDTLHLLGAFAFRMVSDTLSFTDSLDLRWRAGGLSVRRYRDFFRRQILPQYYEDQWIIDPDSLEAVLGIGAGFREAFAVDRLSEHGILPYYLPQIQESLTEAFRQGNSSRILRLSAEIGHYIGDAHVPLHTTENYNGQLSGQDGIHAFWESRLPELFADEHYNYFAGKAAYIERPPDYFWRIVLDSHRLVDSVLRIESELRRTFPADRQSCFEERLGVNVRTPCREFSLAYQDRLRGQVERRMQQSIRAVGSAWYTAWVDAGQPDLSRLGRTPADAAEMRVARELESFYQKGQAKGRTHEQ